MCVSPHTLGSDHGKSAGMVLSFSGHRISFGEKNISVLAIKTISERDEKALCSWNVICNKWTRLTAHSYFDIP